MEVEKYKLIYEVKEKGNIKRILGEEFYKNNYNKEKMIYNNKKITHLRGLFELKNIMNGNLKIKMILSKDCSNKSCMFKDCSSLIQLKFYNNIYNDDEKDILFDNDNILDFDDNNKDTNNKNINNNDKDKILFPFSEIEMIPNLQPNLRKDNLWNAKISVMNEIFSNCSSLIILPDISKWDTFNVIDMSKIFYNCRNLSLLPDISKWNIINVVDMNKMFYNCLSLTKIPDISEWNTKNVSNIDEMFNNCISLVSLPINLRWKDNANYIKDLDDNCLSLINIPDLSMITNNKNNIKFTMNSEFEKFCLIFKSIYKINGEKKIKIYYENFVFNNKDNPNCKMIINNKICKLTDVYEITDDKMKFLKVKLIIFNNEKINFSYMFYECVSLTNFEIYSKQEVEFNKKFHMQKKKIPTSIKNENNCTQINNKSEDIYKTIIENNNYLTSNNSRTNSIYNSSCENQSISLEYELEEKIINSGSNFLSNVKYI